MMAEDSAQFVAIALSPRLRKIHSLSKLAWPKYRETGLSQHPSSG